MLRCILLIILAACDTLPALDGTGQRWPAADQVFHHEPRWLGGDGAYAIDLDDDRTLWLPGPGLVVTYADNSFNFAAVLDPARAQTLYWPHVATLSLERRAP
jgi:hypothetical protein